MSSVDNRSRPLPRFAVKRPCTQGGCVDSERYGHHWGIRVLTHHHLEVPLTGNIEWEMEDFLLFDGDVDLDLTIKWNPSTSDYRIHYVDRLSTYRQGDDPAEEMLLFEVDGAEYYHTDLKSIVNHRLVTQWESEEVTKQELDVMAAAAKASIIRDMQART